MVERAMHFLMLHVIWKARHFMNNRDAQDAEALQESVREQRDALLEKLVEYALGTQSNTLLEVRRAVRLSFPPLFSSSPTDDVTSFRHSRSS